MSEMVERVKATIRAELANQAETTELFYRIEDGTIDGRPNIARIARAAIQAMREPTPEMILDESKSVMDTWIWRSMIDEALK